MGEVIVRRLRMVVVICIKALAVRTLQLDYASIPELPGRAFPGQLINRSYQAIGFLPQRQVYQQNQANRDNVKLIEAQAPQRDNEEHKKCSLEPASRSPKSVVSLEASP